MKYPEIKKSSIPAIIKAAKGVPRTALSYSKSIIAGAKTDRVLVINQDEVNNILTSRMGVDPATGLNAKEFKIIQKVIERGRLSTTAVANLLKTTTKDAQRHYIEPLRAAEWLAVSQAGVIPGYKAHENYRAFVKRET